MGGWVDWWKHIHIKDRQTQSHTHRHGLNLCTVEELFERRAVGGALLLPTVRVPDAIDRREKT